MDNLAQSGGRYDQKISRYDQNGKRPGHRMTQPEDRTDVFAGVGSIFSKYLSGAGVCSWNKKLSGAGVPPREKKKLSLERMTCLADKTNHPVERLSLNRSQCGSCSTKYNTSAGTDDLGPPLC